MWRAAILGVVWLVVLGRGSDAETYSFARSWPPIYSFPQTTGIAVDGSGNVYVADIASCRVQKFTAAGALVTSWGGMGTDEGQFIAACGVAVDGSGNVYVTDAAMNRVQKFTADGIFVATWGKSGGGDGEFGSCTGIAADGTGSVYVVDGAGCRVQKFTTGGTFVRAWGSPGSDAGQFDGPYGVAVDGSGTVYVVDTQNNRIQGFTPEGVLTSVWGSYGATDGAFKYPRSVGVDSLGNVYVADWNNDRVQKFLPDGTFVRSWGSSGSGAGEFNLPSAVAVSSSGTVYVGDTGNDRIEAFTVDGDLVSVWGGSGSANGQFSMPYGVAVASSGSVYVADGDNNRIQRFTSAGVFVSAWGSYGAANSQFSLPRNLAVDSAGNVYVADTGNHRIQKFSSTGSFKAAWGGDGSGAGEMSSPSGVAVDSAGYLYVADSGNARVQKLTPSGAFVQAWGNSGTEPGQFLYPSAVAVDASGYVYVTDAWNNTVQKFTSVGAFVSAWGGVGSDEGQLNNPCGVAVDRSGYVYVSDTSNHRIQKFTSSGSFLTSWGSPGGGDGQFSYPCGLSVDASGNVYVADRYNNRIQEFAPDLTAPVITSPNGGADFLTNTTAALTLSGTCSPTATAIHVNGSAAGVTYVAGYTAWSYRSGVLALGANTFAVTAYNGFRESAANTVIISVDMTPPSVSMSSAASSITNTSPIPVTVAFSEPVNGFTLSDIVVQNGAAQNLTGSGASYTFNLVPAGQGSVTATIASAVCVDAAGNGNTAASVFGRTYDSLRPSVAMSSTTPNPTGANPIRVTTTFSEPVTGFVAADVAVANASLHDFGGSGASYTFELVPIGPGAVTANIAAGVCVDSAGNTNTAAAFTRSYSNLIPLVTLTSALTGPTNQNPISVKTEFSLDVTGFALADLDVSNGSVKNLVAVNAKTYTFDLCPSDQGVVTVNLPAGAATAGLGNEPATFSIVFDSVPPEIVLLGSNPVRILQGEPFCDAGATALDTLDGDLTSRIVADCSAVRTCDVGCYVVTYDVCDAAGNFAVQKTRTVEVVDAATSLPLVVWPTLAALLVAGFWGARRRPARSR